MGYENLQVSSCLDIRLKWYNFLLKRSNESSPTFTLKFLHMTEHATQNQKVKQIAC